MRILVLTPGGDYASDVAAQWAEALAAHTPTLLSGSDVSISHLVRELGGERPELVCYFGHGQPDAWGAYRQATGSNQFQVILGVSDAGQLAGQTVIAVACHTATTLGPASVTAGAARYVGFRSVVSWLPHVPITLAAVSACIRDLLKEEILKSATATAEDLQRVIATHLGHWRDLAKWGDPGAGTALAYVRLIEDGLSFL